MGNKNQNLAVQRDESKATSELKGYSRGLRDAAKLAQAEFWRSPELSQNHSSGWMSGYEDACDHLSGEILKLQDHASPDLEWAAQWIEGSLKGETNERVIQFGKNMAMTFRAAMIPFTVNEPERDAESLEG